MSSSEIKPQSVYASFDTFPAPKGAAVHIGEFAPKLFSFAGSGLLLVLGDEKTPRWQIEDNNVQIRRYITTEENYLQKAMNFSDFIYDEVSALKEDIKIAHFRDPWSGLPILEALEGTKAKFVYEVNALPSIEIPSRISSALSNTLEKIREMELKCLEKADAVICPSFVIKSFLESLGVNSDKITVIHNGARLSGIEHKKPESAPDKYIIYIGAVQPWQGVECLMKAMTFLKDISDLKLVFCASGTKPRIRFLQKLAEKMEISDKLVWNLRIGQSEVQDWLQGASISLAPLTECERNLVQGCCPIKIVESMAAGVPVVASNMPVTLELLEHNVTGWLVRPDRPSELARAIRVLLAHPETLERIAKTAKEKVVSSLSWEMSLEQLEKVYFDLRS
ncbi:MAG: glycosyltransferase [Candidatus Riflebacteria bacterium]|nr:glycosyltransferase [Candidatus Riflebacteria bacterium]